MNRHHCIPKSRIEDWCEKDENNIVHWDKEFHSRYHWLFGTLMPEEIVRFLNLLNTPGTKWTKQDIIDLRERIIAERPKIVRFCTLCDRPLKKKCGRKCTICGETR